MRPLGSFVKTGRERKVRTVRRSMSMHEPRVGERFSTVLVALNVEAHSVTALFGEKALQARTI